MKTITLAFEDSVNRSRCCLALLLIPVVLACFAFLPSTDAQCPEICDGNANTAVGDSALISNTTGFNNTAIGDTALSNNTTGTNNTTTGSFSLASNTTGFSNTAIGFYALHDNTTGSLNIAIGATAGAGLTTGSNNIDIGHNGLTGESNTIRIGKRGVQNTTVIAGIRGSTVSGGVAVVIDSNGRLGTNPSSARFKEAIEAMDKRSEAILALKPVTFRYKHDLDPDGILNSVWWLRTWKR